MMLDSFIAPVDLRPPMGEANTSLLPPGGYMDVSVRWSSAYHWRCWWERWGWGLQRFQWDPAASPETPECSWQRRRWNLLLNQLFDNKKNNDKTLKI